MVKEILSLQAPHRIVKILVNGACLFSDQVHGDISVAVQIQADIVCHMSNNSQRIKPSLRSSLQLLTVLNIDTSWKCLGLTLMELLQAQGSRRVIPLWVSGVPRLHPYCYLWKGTMGSQKNPVHRKFQ